MQNKWLTKYFNLLNIGFVFIVLYLAQGALYANGSIYSQIGVVGLVGLGVFYSLKIINKQSSSAVKVWILFWYLQIITYIFSDKDVVGSINESIGHVNTLEYIKLTSFVFASMCVGYYYASRNKIKDTPLIFWGIVLLLIAILQFLYAINQRLALGWSANFTNNIAYQVLMALPYAPIVIRRNKLLGIGLIVVVLLFVIWGAKRGAILTMCVSLIFWGAIYLKQNAKKRSTWIILIVAGIVCTYLILHFYAENDYLMRRMSKVGTHKETREIAYTMLLNAWQRTDNLFYFFFGRGTWQSVSIWGNFAHNDWLELLTSNGIIGVLFYFVLYIYLFRAVYSSKLDDAERVSAYLCIFCLLIKSFFSMGFMAQFTAVDMILYGVLIGKSYKTSKSHISKKATIDVKSIAGGEKV